jgi:uncharacterized membrane protein HdeD (DUF308 family)
MNWQCNIGKRGRILRGVLGLIALAAGVWLLVREEHEFWAMGLCVLGAFAIFEGIKGWCAIRALGFSPPF